MKSRHKWLSWICVAAWLSKFKTTSVYVTWSVYKMCNLQYMELIQIYTQCTYLPYISEWFHTCKLYTMV